MTQVPKRDAFAGRTCDTCDYWHNPNGEPVGLCVRFPPSTHIVGMMPVAPPAIVNPLKGPPPQMAVPIPMGFYPPREPKMGCGEHAPILKLN